jgi:DNA-binding response OmpR family regulator
MQLLLVTTDSRFAGTLRSWMGLHGTVVDWIILGSQVERSLSQSRYDALLLALDVCDLAVGDVLRRVRRAGHELPLVLIADADDVQERIRLLDLGADDYLTKPVHFADLAARLRVMLRRSAPGNGQQSELRHGDLRLATQSRSVSKDGSHVALTDKEYSLLEALLRNKGVVVSRQRLEEVMNGRQSELASNPVEVHVHHLRRKLGADLITTVRGVGYMLREQV